MPYPQQRLAVILVALHVGISGGGRTLLAAPPDAWPHALAVHDCAPWDGSAVTVYLTDGTKGEAALTSWPVARVSVWRSAESLAGHSFAWPPDTQIGAAIRCTGPNQCVQATGVRITFRAGEPAGTLAGFTELVFADGTTLRGGFRAALRPARVACGFHDQK